MSEMYFFIKQLIEQTSPNYIVIEGVQYQNSQKTFSQLSQLQGVIFSLLFETKIGFCVIEPTAWRKHCDIKGRKRKEQKLATIQMVKELYGLEVPEDVADSIGIGRWAVDNLHKSEEYK